MDECVSKGTGVHEYTVLGREGITARVCVSGGYRACLGAREHIVSSHCVRQTRPHRLKPTTSLCVYVRVPLDLGMWVSDALDPQVERRVLEETSSVQRDRSCLLRDRLQQMSCESNSPGPEVSAALWRWVQCPERPLAGPVDPFPAPCGPVVRCGGERKPVGT